MIQRKQTIWLLLSIIALISSNFIPYAYKATIALPTINTIRTDALNGGSNIISILLIAINIVIAGFAIFLFKKRNIQKILCLVGAGLSIALAIFEFVKGNNQIENAHLSFGFALPILSIILFIMAWRGIIGDEKLLKSIDRLRD